MPTFAEAKTDAEKITQRIQDAQAMFSEILVILKKYEAKDKEIFGDYVDMRSLLFAITNMQTKLNAKLLTLAATVEIP